MNQGPGKDFRANDALFDNLIPLNSIVPPAPPLICIGQDLSLESKSGQINLAGIFASPTGQIVIILPSRPPEPELSSIIAGLQTWDYDKLDSVVSDYTYQESGQAFRIIDIMAKYGRLSFSDAGRLSNSINQCMKTGSFSIFYIDSSSGGANP